VVQARQMCPIINYKFYIEIDIEMISIATQQITPTRIEFAYGLRETSKLINKQGFAKTVNASMANCFSDIFNIKDAKFTEIKGTAPLFIWELCPLPSFDC
jgi:hypothetical protein